MPLERAGGFCGVAAGLVLLLYLVINVFLLPPFEADQAFLEYAAGDPFLAFLDDWLLTVWFMLTMAFALGVHERLAQVASGEARLATAIGLLGLLIATMRGVFNIGRLQTIAASYAATTGPAERARLVEFLRWSEQGDAARNAALVLAGLWVLWSSLLVLRSREFPRALGWFGLVAGLSTGPAFVGFLLGIPFLTHPQGYLGAAFLLWALWVMATGLLLLKEGTGPLTPEGSRPPP